jgi:hypothetical protein
MNRPEHHDLRRRADGRRRVGTATRWAGAAGGGLAAVFGVLLALTAPAPASAASASTAPGPAAPGPAASAPPPADPPPATTVPQHHQATTPLRPPATSPRISSGGGILYGVSGAS